jgi:hypothetical protein
VINALISLPDMEDLKDFWGRVREDFIEKATCKLNPEG